MQSATWLCLTIYADISVDDNSNSGLHGFVWNNGNISSRMIPFPTACGRCPSSMPPPLGSTRSPSCTPELPVSVPAWSRCRPDHYSDQTLVLFITCSARIRDAADLGHLPHHSGRVAGLCRSGLGVCLSVDEEENSKYVSLCVCVCAFLYLHSE